MHFLIITIADIYNTNSSAGAYPLRDANGCGFFLRTHWRRFFLMHTERPEVGAHPSTCYINKYF